MEQKETKLKAEFTAKEGQDFIIEDNRIVLTPSYMQNKWKFAKITATKLYQILGKSSFTTPVQMWASMVKIYHEDMDPMVSKVGTTLEPKIREFVQNYLRYKTKQDFLYKEYNPKEVNYDLWKGIDKYFGGIPDGEPFINNKLDYSTGLPLLEIKTCSIDGLLYKKEGPLMVLQKKDGKPIVKTPGGKQIKWIENGIKHVPEEYQYQIGMYLYLRNQTKGLICCYLVDTEYYHCPEKIEKLDPAKLVGCWVSIDRDEFKKELDKAIKWYQEYVEKGVSPELTEKDRQWIADVKSQKN